MLPIWKKTETGNTVGKTGIQGESHPSETDETLRPSHVLKRFWVWKRGGEWEGSHSCLSLKATFSFLAKVSKPSGRINTHRTKRALERQQQCPVVGVPAKESPSSERSYCEPKAQPPCTWEVSGSFGNLPPRSVASEEAVRGGRWDGGDIESEAAPDSCGVNNSCGNRGAKHSNNREAAVVISEITCRRGADSKYSMTLTVK